MLRALVLLMLLLPATGLAQEPERLALVVGASEYEEDREEREAAGFIVPSRLHNALRDAHLVGEALGAAGFEVERLDDPSKRQLLAAINHLSRRLRAAGDDAVGIFYFAGHGAQGRPPLELDVDNYLIPIGADLQIEIDLEAEALGLSRVSATLSSSGAEAVVIILDACRDFALPQADRSSFTSRGLVEARARPRTIVAYSTAPGDVADDGQPGGNGPYASALARAIREAKGARLEDIFYRVREDVLTATEGDQQPWENSSLIEPVVLGDPEIVMQEPAVPRGDPYGGRDVAVFGAIKDSRIATDFKIFLEDYPESPLASFARTRLAMLTETDTEPAPALEPSGPDQVVEPDPVVPVPAPQALAPDAAEREPPLSREDRRLMQQALNDLGQNAGAADGLFGPRTRAALAAWQRARGDSDSGYLSEEQAAFLVEHGREVEKKLERQRPVEPAVGVYDEDPRYKPGDVFRDCAECPEMVVVPEGSFMMGSPASERGRFPDEGPQHWATIPEPFAIGKYEVTFAEWDACVANGGCTYRPNDEGWGRGRRPVINVSWNDAQAYLKWLSNKTGQSYRLPSEAEWEYAARAGANTSFTWGNSSEVQNANFGGRVGKTMEVDLYPASRWGLHSMHGNVWEWVEDCWNDTYEGAPNDGSAWISGNCSRRVLRGGSWNNAPREVRSASRDGYGTDDWGIVIGFRVARTLR